MDFLLILDGKKSPCSIPYRQIDFLSSSMMVISLTTMRTRVHFCLVAPIEYHSDDTDLR